MYVSNPFLSRVQILINVYNRTTIKTVKEQRSIDKLKTATKYL